MVPELCTWPCHHGLETLAALTKQEAPREVNAKGGTAHSGWSAPCQCSSEDLLGQKFHSLTGRFQCWTGDLSVQASAQNAFYHCSCPLPLILSPLHVQEFSALCQAAAELQSDPPPFLFNTGHTQFSQPSLVQPIPQLQNDVVPPQNVCSLFSHVPGSKVWGRNGWFHRIQCLEKEAGVGTVPH